MKKEKECKKEPIQDDNNGCDSLTNELDLLKQQNLELNDKLLRQLAEFNNYKKRTQKEKEELSTYTKANCINELLTALDSFELALTIDCTDESFKKGMEMTYKLFMEALKGLNISEITALNEPFDPNLHNAVTRVKNDALPENTVCEVMQKGYIIGDKVIRHATVCVSEA